MPRHPQAEQHRACRLHCEPCNQEGNIIDHTGRQQEERSRKRYTAKQKLRQPQLVGRDYKLYCFTHLANEKGMRIHALPQRVPFLTCASRENIMVKNKPNTEQ